MTDFAQLLSNSKQKDAAKKTTEHDKHNKQVFNFVTAKSDKLPDATLSHDEYIEKKSANSKAYNFADLLSRKKKIEKKKPERDVLFGTGLTQKIIEKDKKATHKFELAYLPKEQLKTLETFNFTQTPIEPQPPIVSKPIPSEITWDEYQLAALDGIRLQKFACLIGAAGTGKTTVTKQLVSEIEQTVSLIDLNRTRSVQSDEKDMNVAIAFCAFTGRAVQQMKKALPREYHPMCHTIHATLGYKPEKIPYRDEITNQWKEKLVFRPTFTAQNKLPYECIVIDEGGMVPINLWNELEAAMLPKCRVILIGDINQLPPVQGRSVLGFAMIKWPTFTLEHIHRQAADNPIIANAHKILRGMFPKKDLKKFSMMQISSGSLKAFNQICGVVQTLHKRGLFDPFLDALIVPQNKGPLGQVVLNEKLVHYFNPPIKNEDGTILNRRYVITAGYIHVTYAVGDKIMLLQNDRERGLTNGMTGKVISIQSNGQFLGERSGHNANTKFTGTLDIEDGAELEIDEKLNQKEEDENQRQASHVMTVEFTGADKGLEVPFSTAGQYTKVTHAYAFTCHKSQGGEYPTVVIALHSANIRMLTREWLYTAVTRAQERVVLLFNDRGLAQAVYTQRIKGKTVHEKAQQFIDLQNKADTSLPNLPEPMEI